MDKRRNSTSATASKVFAPMPASPALWDRVYYLATTGHLAPRAMAGEFLYFDPNAAIEQSQIVAVWLAGKDPAARLVGIVRKVTPKTVMLALWPDDNAPLRVTRADAAIHPCIGIGSLLPIEP